ncbi:MAG: phage recombination protein Bet [Candidatus Scalindua sp. AMX11]|nr:MAG: phage recombination protein Bet [Candidatus Scalindua sp.]NOG83798.1 phage recombination protein Bet [Planctomycetota bacterium]RZV82954.1 MAG: phage recombination protein Bet [Candidatus Scalindua sp. SCAELEC01]TDE64424.1 MAG: phage recombination protein Bet [Candidatus Scalindua sp. AMX11]GJQ59751.1 MAG: hypothetical protein SCALA701_25520 [Candidatus Scalindua sp.]
MGNELQVSYQVGTEKVVLTADVVRGYLVSGEGKPSDQEIVFFMKMCKARNLNPWIKDAYLIKYGNRDKAAIVIGKDAILRRAQSNSKYRGHEVEVSEDGKQATCRVFIDGYQVPISVTVNLEEYIGKKADGTVNRQWKQRPKTMLRKCALVAGLREAFTEDLGGLYTVDELGNNESINEMVIPKEVKETPNASNGGSKKKGTKMRPNENDDGWRKTWESFRDTLGEIAFKEVLREMGFDLPEDIPQDRRGEVFEAWSKRAAECL